MNNSYITIIKEKRTALSRKRIPLNQNGCTANFRIGVPFEQNLQYIPSEKYDYTKHEREVIENHIKLFRLNSPERRNREVPLYCKNVINQKSLLLDIRYNNYIVDLFRKKLEKLNSISKAVEICKIVYFMNFIKMAT